MSPADVVFAPGLTTAPDAIPGWGGTARDALLSRLEELAGLNADWDGYGAHALSPLALNTAGQVIDQVLREPLPPPKLVPVPSGGVQLEWAAGSVEIDLEIQPDGRAVFVCDDDGAGDQLDGELPNDQALFGVALRRLLRER